jgi:hypothetical protein
MQWTPWPWLLFHKCVGTNIVIWKSFQKFKQLWSYDYTNQIIKLIRSMNNSRTHHNFGAERWDPQLCDSVSSLRKRSFLKPNVPWDPPNSINMIWRRRFFSISPHLSSSSSTSSSLGITALNIQLPPSPRVWRTARCRRGWWNCRRSWWLTSSPVSLRS